MTVLVGGGAADVADVVDGVAADFPRTALFIIVTTYLVLFALLRSVVLPVKALVMNALSITASFGALVWIFQDGNLSALLGFQPVGFVETTQPVILFCVLFGLSMDYEVFLLSRMKEVWDATGDNTEAVARGLERSGRIVTSAALIVVVVAGSFAFADIVLIKALGLGVAIAVALDATVVRALLVPVDDAPARSLELVDARDTRAVRGQPPAGIRGRDRSGGGPVRGAVRPLLVAVPSSPAAPAARSSPTRRHRGRRSRHRSASAGAGRGSGPRRPATGRRPARPTDRVVVLHGPPRGISDVGLDRSDSLAPRFGFEFVVFRAERGRLPDDRGRPISPSPTRPASLPLRPAARGRRGGRPLAADDGRHVRRASTSS